MAISFFVPGVPAPGGSKTLGRNKAGRGFLRPACKRTKSWMATVAAYAKLQYRGPLLTGPVRVTMIFRFLRPKDHYGTGRNAGTLKANAPKYHTVRPDTTKLFRSTEDAMEGIVYKNDSQVMHGPNEKVYVDRDCGAMITIEKIF